MDEPVRVSFHALDPERLGGMLMRHRDELLRRWERRVLDDPAVPTANDLPRPVLYDRIPALLDRIVERLAAHERTLGWGERAGRQIGSADDIALDHARRRFTLHYSSDEAVRELSHFRSALLELSAEHAVSMNHEEAILVHSTIDELMTATAAELEQSAIRAREEILAIVSHDLRQPLNAILLQAERLRRAAASEIDGVADMLERSGARMRRLVDDLLVLAKEETGRVPVTLARDDARTLVEEASDELRLVAERKHVALVLELPHAPVELSCDRGRLLQALGNVISNAIKFTPEGGTVRVAVSTLDGRCILSVSDTGPGIPAAQIEDVFRPFWQAPGARRPGVGLGLAIARGLVEAHGGTIDVGRAAGGGAVFFLRLPMT